MTDHTKQYLPLDVLKRMSTKRLLNYFRQRRPVYSSYEYEFMEDYELAAIEKMESHLEDVKKILETREHVPRRKT